MTDNAFAMPGKAVTVSATFKSSGPVHTHEFVQGLCECGEVEDGKVVIIMGDVTGEAGEVVSVPVLQSAQDLCS